MCAPCVLALNKIDRVAKPKLLPLMSRYGQAETFEDVVPISASTGDGCDALLDVLWEHLPPGTPGHDPELLTTTTRALSRRRAGPRAASRPDPG